MRAYHLTELLSPCKPGTPLERGEWEGAVRTGGNNVRGLHLKHSQEEALPEEREVGNVSEPVADLCHVQQVHLPQQREDVDQDFGG